MRNRSFFYHLRAQGLILDLLLRLIRTDFFLTLIVEETNKTKVILKIKYLLKSLNHAYKIFYTIA